MIENVFTKTFVPQALNQLLQLLVKQWIDHLNLFLILPNQLAWLSNGLSLGYLSLH